MSRAEDRDDVLLLPEVANERGRTDSAWAACAPLAVFAAVELFALVLWSVLGRFQWFYYDEWDFLAARKAGDFGDLFRPHNEHWSTIPILIYRFAYSIVGLHTYLPYEVIVIVLHLTAAWLLLVVMRRALVQPWLATAAASLFALFGAGYFNIVMAFQVGFTGALVAGLGHLLLADHDGPIDRRDWLGLLAGLIGLMMSGVAVTMVIVVGISVLWRRGWRLALLHTVPLSCVYLIWYFAIGDSGYANDHPTLGGVVPFADAGLRAAYGAMGQLPGVGLLLGFMLIVGYPLGYLARTRSGHVRELAASVGLLIGSVIFITITATGRLNHGDLAATHSRYIHLIAAMTLPALAVAADAIARRFRWFLPIGLALFLVGIPGNIRALADEQRAAKPASEATRQMMLNLPRDPLARELARGYKPEPRFAGWVTIGWLLDGVAHHRIPAPPRVSPQDLAGDRLRLSFALRPTSAPVAACHLKSGTHSVALHTGDEIVGPVTITPANDPKFLPAPLRLAPGRNEWFVVLRDIEPIMIRGTAPNDETLLCIQTAAPA
jgi:hypothetical protein